MFQIAPYDERDDPPAPIPTLWVGVSLDKAVRRTDTLLEQLAAVGFRLAEDREGTGKVQYVGRFIDLGEVLGGARTTGEQVNAVTEWITEQIEGLTG
ncbi:MAG: hypothetical protein M3071_04035 [Actinomycetota bacterium]|nr:hypothetical protein [Actinomycetota bacterium]